MNIKQHQRAAAIVAGLLGKPYRAGAEGPDAFDCYGLARHVLAVHYGEALPEFPRDTGTARETARILLAHDERHLWQAIAAPCDGALVVMGNIHGRDYHLGVYLRTGATGVVLHADESLGVMADDVTMLGLKGFHRITFFVRGARAARAAAKRTAA